MASPQVIRNDEQDRSSRQIRHQRELCSRKSCKSAQTSLLCDPRYWGLEYSATGKLSRSNENNGVYSSILKRPNPSSPDSDADDRTSRQAKVVVEARQNSVASCNTKPGRGNKQFASETASTTNVAKRTVNGAIPSKFPVHVTR